jgi:hypothetical protein
MAEQQPLDGDQDRFEIVFELPPSPHGANHYEREGGTIVHGDAGGEWTLGEDGEIDDIVFFVSPGWMRGRAERTRDG